MGVLKRLTQRNSSLDKRQNERDGTQPTPANTLVYRLQHFVPAYLETKHNTVSERDIVNTAIGRGQHLSHDNLEFQNSNKFMVHTDSSSKYENTSALEVFYSAKSKTKRGRKHGILKAKAHLKSFKKKKRFSG